MEGRGVRKRRGSLPSHCPRGLTAVRIRACEGVRVDFFLWPNEENVFKARPGENSFAPSQRKDLGKGLEVDGR